MLSASGEMRRRPVPNHGRSQRLGPNFDSREERRREMCVFVVRHVRRGIETLMHVQAYHSEPRLIPISFTEGWATLGSSCG
jgi:hypothetical protein